MVQSDRDRDPFVLDNYLGEISAFGALVMGRLHGHVIPSSPNSSLTACPNPFHGCSLRSARPRAHRDNRRQSWHPTTSGEAERCVRRSGALLAAGRGWGEVSGQVCHAGSLIILYLGSES